MKPVRTQAVHCVAVSLLLASALAEAQTSNRNAIVLDPPHGGQDRGATFNNAIEKDLTLSLAGYLRASLAARGIPVFTTRDADLPANAPLLTADQRAGIANHVHPAACVVLHATPSGNGIHIATSSLTAPLLAPEANAPVTWDTGQAAYLPQSLHLANTLGLALIQAHLPVMLTRAALRPLDNLTCPAIAVEVSPLQLSNGRSTPVNDAGYQRHVAEVFATTLLAWQSRAANRMGTTP